MNIKLFNILFLLPVQLSVAQVYLKGFYAELGINSKFNTNYPYYSSAPLVTENFRVQQRNIINTGIPLPNIGLGYKFADRDELILNYQFDEVSVGYRADFTAVSSFTPSPSLVNGFIEGYFTTLIRNYSFQYKRLIYKNFSPHFRQGRYLGIQLNLGLSFYRNISNDFVIVDGITYTAPDSSRINLVFTSGINYSNKFLESLKLITGIGFNFGSSTNDYFNFTISYLSGRQSNYSSNYGSVNVQAVVADNSGSKVLRIYGTTFLGKGNGLYLQLSKKIFPFQISERRSKKRIKELLNTKSE